MERRKSNYRKNFSLVASFLVLISVTFFIALGFAYKLTQKYIENEFVIRKVDVLDETVESYYDFYHNKIAEVSFYQGFLDSVSGRKYADSVLEKFPVVERIIFSDVNITGDYLNPGFAFNNLFLSPKAIYQYKRGVRPDSIVLYRANATNGLSLKLSDEFNKMAVRFASFIESADSTESISNHDIFKTFYAVSAGIISYMTIPRREEIKVFKDMMQGGGNPGSVYEQDIMTYYLNPARLQIENVHPELYQTVEIRPAFYDPLEENPARISTEIILPGALTDYKLFFWSSKEFLDRETRHRFLPIAAVVIVIYGFLFTIALLIYRNLNINRRMFKLQYDFVNNLSHEFKTPLSVIKIAGNNIVNAGGLSDEEHRFYGKILEEEADKLNNLLNTLLSFTQIENKSIPLKLEVLDLREFCENFVNSYKIKYPDFDIQYEIRDVNFFRTDVTLLTSIFQNLTNNAYRYSSPERRFLRIRIFKEKKQLVIVFQDRGIGIAKHEQQNIFKKFYRIQSQYNQQGSVGLGLAFCKEVINMMNGDITVDSKEGRGSKFTITLPMEKQTD